MEARQRQIDALKAAKSSLTAAEYEAQHAGLALLEHAVRAFLHADLRLPPPPHPPHVRCRSMQLSQPPTAILPASRPDDQGRILIAVVSS